MLKIDTSTFLAYPPEFHALEAIMRMQAVKRWHMIETTRVQTLAEHSCNVALLAGYIARTAPHSFFDAFTKVTFAALVHDIPESFTGDIPSHTKRFIKGIDDLEDAVTPPAMGVSCSLETVRMIKMCDLADGIRFIRLHGVDQTAFHAQQGLERQLSKKFEEANHWPVEVFDFVMKKLMIYTHEKVEM